MEPSGAPWRVLETTEAASAPPETVAVSRGLPWPAIGVGASCAIAIAAAAILVTTRRRAGHRRRGCGRPGRRIRRAGGDLADGSGVACREASWSTSAVRSRVRACTGCPAGSRVGDAIEAAGGYGAAGGRDARRPAAQPRRGRPRRRQGPGPGPRRGRGAARRAAAPVGGAAGGAPGRWPRRPQPRDGRGARRAARASGRRPPRRSSRRARSSRSHPWTTCSRARWSAPRRSRSCGRSSPSGRERRASAGAAERLARRRGCRGGRLGLGRDGQRSRRCVAGMLVLAAGAAAATLGRRAARCRRSRAEPALPSSRCGCSSVPLRRRSRAAPGRLGTVAARSWSRWDRRGTATRSRGWRCAVEPGPVRVAATLPAFPAVRAGDTVEVRGRLRPPPEDDRYGEYLRRTGAAGSLRRDVRRRRRRRPRVSRSSRSETQPVTRSARALPEPEAGLAAGILIGLRERVDRVARRGLRDRRGEPRGRHLGLEHRDRRRVSSARCCAAGRGASSRSSSAARSSPTSGGGRRRRRWSGRRSWRASCCSPASRAGPGGRRRRSRWPRPRCCWPSRR